MVGNASACHSGCKGPQAPQGAQDPHSEMSQELPDDLTCNICKELFQAAVTIKTCNHSFCSFCVRRSFAQQSKQLKPKVTCPHCRKPLFERSCSKADKILKVDRELQQRVFDCKQQLRQQQPSQHQEEDKSPRRRSTRRSSPLKVQKEDSKATRKPNPPLQKLVPLHHHGKKRKDLVKLLNTYGLSTTGKDDELRQRLVIFHLYWNSMCDEHVDPPSRDEVMRQFRSAEASKANAKFNDTIRRRSLDTTTSSTSTESSSADAQAQERAAVLREYANQFQELYNGILEKHGDTWSDKMALAIAALQTHPMIQNDDFRQCLRERAMNGNYEIPIKDLLSGNVPLPKKLPNLLPLAPKISGAKAADASSQSAAARTETLSNTQHPSSLQERIERPREYNCPEHAAKRQKQSGSFTANTTSASRPAATNLVTNPYSKSRSSNYPSAVNHSALKSAPMGSATVGRPAPTASARQPISNPYSNRGSKQNLPPANNGQYRTHVNVAAPAPHISTTSASARQVPNPYSGNTQNQSSKRMSAPSHQSNSTYRTSYTSISAASKPPASNTVTTPRTAASQPRHAVSPPTVATSSTPSLFQQSKKAKRKPSWHWTCQIEFCKYVNKMDRTAKRCASCGGLKGATLDDPMGENIKLSGDGSSQDDPITI